MQGRMSEMRIESRASSPKLLNSKCLDLECNAEGENEGKGNLYMQYYGLSAIKKSSGIICLKCMKFFCDEIAAQEHETKMIYTQCYDVFLQEYTQSGQENWNCTRLYDTVHEDKLFFDEECYGGCGSKKGSEDMARNDELITIKQCSGIVCSVCRKFFVDETSAGQHTKSLKHYIKCFGLTDKKDEERSNPFVPEERNNTNNLIQPEKDTSEALQRQNQETDSKADLLMKLDNEWWNDFDKKLGNLLEDIFQEYDDPVCLEN